MAEEIHCVPAAPPAPPAAPGPDDDSAAKTMIVDRGGKSKTTLVVGLLAFFLLAGIVTAVAVKRGFTADAGSAATATETTAPEKATDDAAPAAPAGTVPAECVGDIADPQLRWYCTEFLPFAQKASADHDRIDRLEAERRNGGVPGVPMGLWIVVIAIGVLTAFNTVKILSSGKGEKPPAG